MTKTAISSLAIKVFEKAVDDYHVYDDINRSATNPYDKKDFEHLLYEKNWIDTVQWHYEDIIRDPDIESNEGMKLKRLIDSSNQNRTEMVEYIDSYFLNLYKQTTPKKDAKVNTESPAWALDRLSILILKIYHMREESLRTDVSDQHKDSCSEKLKITEFVCVDFGSERGVNQENTVVDVNKILIKSGFELIKFSDFRYIGLYKNKNF